MSPTNEEGTTDILRLSFSIEKYSLHLKITILGFKAQWNFVSRMMWALLLRRENSLIFPLLLTLGGLVSPLPSGRVMTSRIPSSLEHL